MDGRTNLALTFMEANQWDLTPDKQYVTINQIKYRVLSRDVHELKEPIASIGKGREIILVDPASPCLDKEYQALKTKLVGISGTQNILDETMNFVRETFSEIDEEKVENTAAQSKQQPYKQSAVTSLDDFVLARTGVCRHHSLFLYYLLHSLMRENVLPQGTLYHHRDDVENSQAHSWVMLRFHAPHELYHLDSMWYEEAYLLQDDLENDDVLRKYGSSAAKNCKARYPWAYQLTGGTFTSHSDGFFTCNLTDGNKNFLYQKGKSLGKGCYGEIFAMTRDPDPVKASDPLVPDIVVKELSPTLTFPKDTSGWL